MNNTAAGEWNACLDRLYEAVGTESSALGEAVGAFRPFFGAQRSAIVVLPGSISHRSARHIASCGIPAAMLVEYQSHYYAHDEWAKAGMALGMPQGHAFRGSDLVSRKALRESYFYRDFMVRYGLNDILTTIVETPTEFYPGAFVTFQRQVDQPLYSAQAVRQMEQLAPHLGRALRLHRRLAPELAIGLTLRELFDRMDLAMWFLRGDGSVVQRNRSAARILEAGGELLQSRNGKLEYRSAGRWTPLAETLQRFRQLATEHLELSASGDGLSADLTLRRAHSGMDAENHLAEDHSVAVLTYRRSSRGGDALRALYAFTAMEARVAGSLAAGLSTAQTAAELRVTVATIRSHISTLFEKTGTHRQAELVSLLLRGGAS